jgi:hypothetical protein
MPLSSPPPPQPLTFSESVACFFPTVNKVLVEVVESIVHGIKNQ